MGNDLQDTGIDKKFMYRTLIAKGLAPRINRYNYLKLRHFIQQKKLYPQSKTAHRMG